MPVLRYLPPVPPPLPLPPLPPPAPPPACGVRPEVAGVPPVAPAGEVPGDVPEPVVPVLEPVPEPMAPLAPRIGLVAFLMLLLDDDAAFVDVPVVAALVDVPVVVLDDDDVWAAAIPLAPIAMAQSAVAMAILFMLGLQKK